MYKAAFVAVLKPADDIRLFQKIAQTFWESGFEIFNFGSQSNLEVKNKNSNIHFYPIFKFFRSSFQRLWAGLLILKYLWKVKPQILVCGAVELLPFCVLYKFFQKLSGKKLHLIYDVQENYFLNVLHTETYKSWWVFRKVLAYSIRLVEWLCASQVDTFFLAEKCYQLELSFVKKRCLVLENKVLKINFQEKNVSNPIFLLSGTIAPEYGLWKAIDFAEKVHCSFPQITLKIAGRCSRKEVFSELVALQEKKPFLQLEISEKALNYEILQKNFAESTFWLMPYQVNPAYQNRIPTKFYEAMAWQKWIFVQKNPVWENFFKEYAYPYVIWIDFQKPKTWQEALDISKILQKPSYQNPQIFWDSEKEKLQKFISTWISSNSE
jgi:glycosyltransferase involved in cell wall biosynthesis